MQSGIRLSVVLWEKMQAHLLSCLPQEGCGLIGGRNGSAEDVIAVLNDLRSPNRFRMNPEAQLQALLAFEARGMQLVGIYHSHPCGPVYPSETDLAEFYYPGVVSLICAPGRTGWQVKGFSIERNSFMEVAVYLDDLT